MTQRDDTRDSSPSDDERDDEELTRVRRRPRLGTKVTTLIGLSLVACTVYFLFAPVYMDTANGWFGCGNFIHGSDSEFVNEACDGATQRNGALAFLSGALAILIGGIGAVFFGFDSEIERRGGPLRRDRDDPSGRALRQDRFLGDVRGRSTLRQDRRLGTSPRRRRSTWDE